MKLLVLLRKTAPEKHCAGKTLAKIKISHDSSYTKPDKN